MDPPTSPITDRIEGDPDNRSELVPLPDEDRYVQLCEVAFGRLLQAKRSYNTVWTYLMMPLAVTFTEDEHAIHYFEKVAALFRSQYRFSENEFCSRHSTLNPLSTADVRKLRQSIGELVNKLRVVLPDLYCYMDEEDVGHRTAIELVYFS